MGLFDDLLKTAAKSIDKAIGNGSHDISDLANKALDLKNEVLGGENAENKTVEVQKTVQNSEYDNVVPALPSRIVETEKRYKDGKRKITFSLTQDFVYEEADYSFPIH